MDGHVDGKDTRRTACRGQAVKSPPEAGEGKRSPASAGGKPPNDSSGHPKRSWAGVSGWVVREDQDGDKESPPAISGKEFIHSGLHERCTSGGGAVPPTSNLVETSTVCFTINFYILVCLNIRGSTCLVMCSIRNLFNMLILVWVTFKLNGHIIKPNKKGHQP